MGVEELIMGCLMIVFYTQYFSCDQIEKKEMCLVCNTIRER